MICTAHQVLFGRSNQEKWDGQGMWHVWKPERDRLEVLGVNRMIILKCIFMKWDGRRGLDWSGSGERKVAGCCEHSNEPSGSVQRGEFLG